MRRLCTHKISGCIAMKAWLPNESLASTLRRRPGKSIGESFGVSASLRESMAENLQQQQQQKGQSSVACVCLLKWSLLKDSLAELVVARDILKTFMLTAKKKSKLKYLVCKTSRLNQFQAAVPRSSRRLQSDKSNHPAAAAAAMSYLLRLWLKEMWLHNSRRRCSMRRR